jgi:hypothetical protein
MPVSTATSPTTEPSAVMVGRRLAATTKIVTSKTARAVPVPMV